MVRHLLNFMEPNARPALLGLPRRRLFFMRRSFGKTLLLLAILSASASAWADSGRAVNISTRASIQTGDNILIGGFIITGTSPKRVIVRALGPSLPLAQALRDPVLELHGSTGLLANNDSWRSTQESEIMATGIPPANDSEAAIVRTLDPGAYTVLVRGANNGTGLGLVEVYDLDAAGVPTRLANISTRGRVGTGDDVMIGGFIVSEGSKRVILRARGPTLSLGGAFLTDRLMNPQVTLHDANGAVIAQNDNWRSQQEAEIAASGLAPTDANEPALVATLSAGPHTFVVRGVNGTSGVALIELYDLDQPSQADGSTLYLAQLRAQNGIVSNGSGSGTLRLAADGASATLAFNFTNLSSAVVSMHVHAQGGTILFDIDDAQPQPDGTYLWTIVPAGNFTVADIVAMIRSGQTYLNIHTSNFPTGEISGFFNFSTGGQAAPVPTPPPALPGGTPTVTDATRLLEQATFGPKSTQITQVRNQGLDAFLTEQFNTAPTYLLPFVDASGVNPPGFVQLQDAFWNRAIAAPDQLRQRVAFALSEILVVSAEGAGLGGEGVGLAAYYDVLLRDAFGNFRDLLEDVTLNPAMGRYLDMLRNAKANPARGTLPNENFAREVLQLFSIGLFRLHLDGTVALSSLNLPIETYDQQAILGFSQVFTGWTFVTARHAQFFQCAGKLSRADGQRGEPARDRGEDDSRWRDLAG